MALFTLSSQMTREGVDLAMPSREIPDGVPHVLSLARVAILCLEYGRAVLGLAVVGGFVGVLLHVVRPRYVAESTFAPRGSSGALAGLAGVAAQFGVNIAPQENEESVEFLGRLLQSREFLSKVVLAEYRFATGEAGEATRDTLNGTLLQLYRIRRPRTEAIQEAVRKLRNNMSVRVDLRTNTVTLGTKARYPELASQVNRRVLETVNEFNLERRQIQARDERVFVEARRDTAEAEFRSAEDQLEDFLKQNRRYQDSPDLTFQASRLQRRVDLRQQVYLTLAQTYEQARIEEVRNTPVITVVDSPEGSSHHSSTLVVAVTLGAMVGGTLGFMVAVVLAFVRREREIHPQDYRRLTDLVREVNPFQGKAMRT
jgi:uncharacterized protein involved in exopolysaccharide biosynthesis